MKILDVIANVMGLKLELKLELQFFQYIFTHPLWETGLNNLGKAQPQEQRYPFLQL